MKKIFNLILCALCVLSYTSCNDDEGIEYTQVSPGCKLPGISFARLHCGRCTG